MCNSIGVNSIITVAKIVNDSMHNIYIDTKIQKFGTDNEKRLTPIIKYKEKKIK